MSLAFQQFKEMKIKTITQTYNSNVNNLIKQYNSNVQTIIKTPNIRNKAQAISKLKRQFNNNFNSLKAQYLSDVNTINKMVMPQNNNTKNSSALVIGINYIGTQYELNGCINDASSMRDLLINNGFKKIKLITDNTTDKPNRNIILSEFKNLLSNANNGDIIFFSYSGHGSYKRDTNGDEKTGNDQLICPLDFNMIVDDELKTLIDQNLKQGVTLITFFDSCHSGSVLDLRYQYMDSLYGNNLTENTKQTETKGNVIMISGCNDKQTSADAYIDNKNQGAMTWSFLNAYSNKDITWRQLLINMRDLLKNSKFDQIPQLTSGSFFDIDKKVFI
jgi:hypothetical protein